MLVFNTINECRSGTERTLLTYLLPEKVTMLSTFITLPHLLCCSMKHIFCRSNYLLINNLFIYTFYPSIFSLCGHFYFGCSKCSIPWCRNYWHLAPTFNIFSFVLLFDAAYSSHCSIFFVSSRSSTTCVCRDATTLFLSFTSAMVYQVASSYDCVVATLVIWSGWRHALTPQHT